MMKSILTYITCVILLLPYADKVIYYIYWNVNRTEIASYFCENKDDKTQSCFAQCQLNKVIQKESSQDKLPVMPAQTYQFSVYTPVSFQEWFFHSPKKLWEKIIIPYSEDIFPEELSSVSTPPPEWV